MYIELKNPAPSEEDFAELYRELENSPINLGLNRHPPVEKKNIQAMRHLFQVTSGLKSMALGETQITGQVKRDMAYAEEKNLLSSFFKTILQKAFEVQKLIRSQTDIGQNPISLLTLMERDILRRWGIEELKLNKVYIGGTGDMAQKALRFVLNKGSEEITVVRKDIQASIPKEFARIISRIPEEKVRYIDWESFHDKPHDFDLFITSTFSEIPFFTEEEIVRWKKERLIPFQAVFVDLGLPANIGVQNENDHAQHVINLDDLKGESERNRATRIEQFEDALPWIDRGINVLAMDIVYRRNTQKVGKVLEDIDRERQQEWDDLISGPLKGINAKQQRILYDYMRKLERKTLRTHKELFIEMLTLGQEHHG